MIIHHSKVVLRGNKYYLKKGVSGIGNLVTARVLFFAKSGDLECDFNFKDGIFNGVQKLYKDVYFQMSSEENYKNGIRDGNSKFYKDGKLYKEFVYNNGHLISEKCLKL